MKLDLDRMLAKCENGHWDVNAFDWSRKSTLALSRHDEIRVCQHFLNLSYIERMAAALFLSLSKRMSSPTVKAIYRHFHTDEIRHAHAMARLQDYFDVHHYQTYTPSRAMLAFIPYFTGSLDSMNPAFANNAVTIGELFLDIALLRALNDFVDDPLSRAVIEKVNQDESRHVTMDFYMTEYCADHILPPKIPPRWPALLNPDVWGTTIWGQGFAYDVFIVPMQYLDPRHVRQQEALVRIRRLFEKAEVANNPAVASATSLIAAVESPLGRRAAEIFRSGFNFVTGIDLGFVQAAASENLQRTAKARGTRPRTKSAVDMAAEMLEA